MPPRNYRIYCLNDRGGINLADWIEADNDDEAIRRAQEIEHGAVLAEVWDQNRLIATLKEGAVNLNPPVDDEPEQIFGFSAQRGASA